MDSEKCNALLTILKEGSLTAAADRLGYSPSGLSRMVASLEEDAGFPLLHRSRHGVTPTDACRRLLPVFAEALRVETQYRQTCAAIQGLDVGVVTVGTAYSIYYRWLSNVIAAFTHQYPGIEVRIRDGKSTDLCRMLTHHEIDFCIVSRREGDFSWKFLFQDPLVAAVSAGSPYAQGDTFPVADLAQVPFIETFQGQDTDNARMLEQNHISPNVQFATDDTYASHRMVEAGLGVSLSNYIEAKERERDQGVKLLPLDPPQLVEIGIATPRPDRISPAAKIFRDFAARFTSELLDTTCPSLIIP